MLSLEIGAAGCFDPALVQVTWGDLPLPTDATVLRTGDWN
jgi:hypothetical protein